MRDLLLARNPGSEHLIAWTREQSFLDLLERVAGSGRVHPLAAVIPDYEYTRYVIDAEHDGHPNRLAAERVARYVLEEIVGLPDSRGSPSQGDG